MRTVTPFLFLGLLGTALRAAPESHRCQNGLVRTLVAREPMFFNPVAVAVDVDGTFYIAEAARRKIADPDIREMMQWVADDLSHSTVGQKRDFIRKHFTGARLKNTSIADHDRNGRIDWNDLTVPSEKIHRLRDQDGDGTVDEASVFAAGFNTEITGTAAGVFARRGDVYATIAPDLWRLRDADGDGRAERRAAILTGFAPHISYSGHDMHGLTLGPDGKLYWTIGDKGLNVVSDGVRWFYPDDGAVMRANLDGSGFEVFARGLRNVQQIAFDDNGDLFGCDNDSDQQGEKERLVHIPEGSDAGWRSYYQYRGGGYNPWMAERMAFPDGPDQPACIVPPLSNHVDGPSGFAYNPGTALNERYRGHFFVTQFPAGKINAFRLEPAGASFKIAGDHQMAGGTAFTGCNFGPDGALYVVDWQGGYPLKQKGALWRIDDPKEAGGAVRWEVATFLRNGTAKLEKDALVARLGHADQRVRLDAQWELAGRKEWAALKKVAAAADATRPARIHALWGLAQGRHFDTPLFAALSRDADPELRAQTAKWAGDCGPPLPDLAPLLADPAPRVRYQAAMAVGKLRANLLLPALPPLIARDSPSDPALRHAGIFALRKAGAGHPDAVASFAKHPAPAVRLAAAAAIRGIVQDHVRHVPEGGAGALSYYPASHAALLDLLLQDPDPAVVAEAARAIYDVPLIERGLPALGRLLAEKPEARESALRRSIAANRRLGDEAALLRLATFAADRARPDTLRIAALDALASVKSSERLDSVDGRHLPLQPLQVAPALAAKIALQLAPAAKNPKLSKPVAAALDALGAKQDPAALTRQALDPQLDPSLRVAALRHLQASGDPKWIETAIALLKQDSPAPRPAVAALLATTQPELALSYLRNIGLASPDLAERQAGITLLGGLPGSAADALLKSRLNSALTDRTDGEVLLELLDAARRRPALHELVEQAEKTLEAGFPGGKNAPSLAGGNAGRGAKLFAENLAANCTACHRVGAEGSNVGPPLAKVGAKGREHLLESLVNPQAKVAPGYGLMNATRKDGSVAAGAFLEEKDGKLILSQPDGSQLEVPLSDIAARTEPVSTMPPMGEILKPAELRDLVEYLASLK